MRDIARGRDRIDLVMAATIAALLATAGLIVVDPHRVFVAVDRGVDLAVSAFSFLAAFLMAIMALVRYRVDGTFTRLLQAGAAALVAAFLGGMVILLATQSERVISLGLLELGRAPAWLSVACRSVVGVLMAWAGWAALRREHRVIRRPGAVIVGGIVLLGLVCLGIAIVGERLPAYLAPEGIARLRALASMPSLPHGLTHGGFRGIMPLAFVAGLIPAVLAALGSAWFWASARRGGPVSASYLAVGLAIAALAELLNAAVPSVYAGFVTTSDLLRLAFFSVFLIGIVAEERADIVALRASVREQERLGALAADRVVLEERARLARDLHDGLSQHLFFAKLKLDRLEPSLDGEAKALADEAAGAIDAAIVEAREALVALRDGHVPGLSLAELLEQSGRQVAGRAGIAVRIQAAADLPERIEPDRQAELLRIVREALTNVVRHADATVVRIRAEREDRKSTRLNSSHT